ncbi:MAG: hypothetical protein U0Q03_21955 [Acidimicrobiales bacterium]
MDTSHRSDTPVDTEALDQVVWLLRSKVNPFPVKAHLRLVGRTLALELPPEAADCVHGWVAERLGRDSDALTAELRAGRTVAVGTATDPHVTWPRSFAGSAMEFELGGHEWIVCLAYPSGGALLQTMNLLTARGRAKAWKRALEG